MNYFKGLIILFTALSILSCNKDDETNEFIAANLEGTWHTDNFNIVSLDDSTKTINGYSFDIIRFENGQLTLNQKTGRYTLDGRKLTMVFDGYPRKNHEIVFITQSKMSWQVTGTESYICCDFGDFESNEILLFTEYLTKY